MNMERCMNANKNFTNTDSEFPLRRQLKEFPPRRRLRAPTTEREFGPVEETTESKETTEFPLRRQLKAPGEETTERVRSRCRDN